MIEIKDGRKELFQWDTGREVLSSEPVTQFHFSNRIIGRTVDVDAVENAAKIPDFLLQSDADLKVYAFVGGKLDGYTKVEKIFKVRKRNKPADYVFTPTEQMTIEDIKRIAENAESMAQSVRNDADAGKFKGDKGDKGDTGNQGEQGLTGAPGKDGKDAVTDPSLSETSENAVQNKVVTNALKDKADKSYVNNTFANAFRQTDYGAVIASDMVSPVEHDVECRVESKNRIITSVIKFEKYNCPFYEFSEPVIPGEYSISVKTEQKSQNLQFSYFDKEKKQIDGVGFYPSESGLRARTFLVKKEVCFFRFISDDTGAIDLNDVQLERGTVATPYTPYVPDLSAVKVSRYGKNLLQKQPTNITSPYSDLCIDFGKDVTFSKGITIRVTLKNFTCKTDTAALWAFRDHLNNEVGAVEYAPAMKFIGVSKDTIYNKELVFEIKSPVTFAKFYFMYWGRLTGELLNAQVNVGTEKPYEAINRTVYPVSPDGTVSGMTSLSPSMTLLTDTEGVAIEATYNLDGNKVVSKLTERIAALENAAVNNI